ncbi:MAG TPA: hypothetical protein ENK16_02685 [Chromatiales bacterium]|nr:hypothetical protein [Chromatiales bacterium]
MGFIRNFLLPKETDFDAALLAQARIGREMVDLLYQACARDDPGALQAIDDRAKDATQRKNRNMKELLDVFIAPYDKESIYRMITQLDWIALSVKHFRLQTVVYDIHSLGKYEPILAVLKQMATTLETGMTQLGNTPLSVMEPEIGRLRDLYDEVVSLCARATGRLSPEHDCVRLLQERDILMQLKEIAKRIHISANTLEDMTIKIT